MIPVAVLATLWPRQLGALDSFLSAYGPTTVVVPRRYTSPALTAIARAHDSRVVIAEKLLPKGYSRDERAAPILDVLRHHLASGGGLPADLEGAAPETLRAIVDRAATAEVPEAIQLLDALEAVRGRHDVALYVTTEDVTQTGRLVAAWAAAHGIPSLQIAHSIALADPATAHAQLGTDLLAVYGRRGAEGYLDLGIAPERIVITGNPAWDEYAGLAGRRRELRAELVQRHGLDPERPIVVFGTTYGGHQTALEPPGDPNFLSLQAFVLACEELAGWGVRLNAVVKDRWANRTAGSTVLDAVVEATGARGSYIRTAEDTQIFAAAADVLVAVDSNYMVEAMMMGTPVVNLVSDSLTVLGPTFEEETGVVEAEPHQLAAAIRRLVTDDDFRAARLAQAAERLEYYHHGGVDGQAGRRVGELMAQLALPRPGRLRVLADRAVRAVKRGLKPVVRRLRRAASRGRTR